MKKVMQGQGGDRVYGEDEGGTGKVKKSGKSGKVDKVSDYDSSKEAQSEGEESIKKIKWGTLAKDVAPFSDAGLTAYRVVKKATRHLLPGQSCVIIGAGGLGHIAIQCLKAMCAADIIIVEKSEMALKHALELGGDKGVLIDGNEHESIMELTHGKGAEAVIDFVGEHGSTSMGLKMTADGGYYYIVGYGEEIKVLAVDMIISEKNIVGNLVGTWAELYELMELANRGKVTLSMQEYRLDEANKALHDLNAGNVKGRAVLVP